MENTKLDTWVLVHDGKNVLGIVEPGLKTTTPFTLVEFATEEELRKYIIDNELIEKDNK